MLANNLKQKDLLDIFGTPSIVSEVLHGKRQTNHGAHSPAEPSISCFAGSLYLKLDDVNLFCFCNISKRHGNSPFQRFVGLHRCCAAGSLEGRPLKMPRSREPLFHIRNKTTLIPALVAS